jgi:hypothetical protein
VRELPIRLSRRSQMRRHVATDLEMIQSLYQRVAIWQQRYRADLEKLEALDRGLRDEEFIYYTRYGRFPTIGD